METVAFGQLYERYAQDVLRFAFYLTGNHAEAEDITSETFVRAWVESDALRVGTVKAYLFMIARNLHVDWRRRESRRAALGPEPADPAPGPETESRDRSELRAIVSALQRLPEIDRSALLLRAQHDMPYETIAHILGVSPGAVRVKVHRARLRLAELRAARR
jgi:RNA polymerase sigma-70 factor (ECF subfamily)